MTSFAVRNVLELPEETNLTGRPAGVTRRTLHSAPDGSGVTWLLEFPRGYRSEWGRGREDSLEAHDSTEEVVVLEGALGFGQWYELGPLHYSLHPAGWLHPAHQHSDVGCLILIRRDSAEIDFTFAPAPPEWNARLNSPDSENSSRGVANVGLEEILVSVSSRLDTELVAHRLSHSLANNMQLMVVSVPPGWKSDHGALGARGTETLVLEGNVGLSSTQAGDITLGRYGYFVGSPDSHDHLVGSEDGALLLRWTTASDGS